MQREVGQRAGSARIKRCVVTNGLYMSDFWSSMRAVGGSEETRNKTKVGMARGRRNSREQEAKGREGGEKALGQLLDPTTAKDTKDGRMAILTSL